jgi:hypothetical protein
VRRGLAFNPLCGADVRVRRVLKEHATDLRSKIAALRSGHVARKLRSNALEIEMG